MVMRDIDLRLNCLLKCVIFKPSTLYSHSHADRSVKCNCVDVIDKSCQC